MDKEEYFYEPSWDYLTDPVILNIFSYLSANDILSAGATCHNWNRICYDELLWKRKFRTHFNIKYSTEIKPGETSWLKEFKRLSYHTPLIETEVLKNHTEPVLHVTFSHNGQYFVTCSKDAFVLVWNSAYPASIRYSYDMKQFSWKFSQYAEFNESDTLLLVCGAHFGKIDDTSGEIAVFSLDDDMSLICRILNKPYDVFGTFFSEEYIFTGQVKQVSHLTCASHIWIHKAYPDVISEHKPLMSRIFRFLNENASFIRTLLVAKYKSNAPDTVGAQNENISEETPANVFRKNIICQNTTNGTKPPLFFYNDDYKSVESVSENSSDTESSKFDCASHSNVSLDEDSETDSDEDLSTQPEKILIFTTGCETYTPHQIGIKRIGRVTFPKKLDPGPSLAERIAEQRDRAQQHPVIMGNLNFEHLISSNFDPVDHIIDFHGHIIGMKLSPDHRYLYVNCRPWPEGYVIAHPLDPPPVAQEIDIHVIDLTTFKEVGIMLRAHKAYTCSEESFMIFLDVSSDYVASGSEDKHAYLWDRHYGIGLAKFPHNDVVNSVAFNPKDPETLISVSDDYSIKIWRSRARASEIFTNKTAYPKAIELTQKRKQYEKKITKNCRVIL